MPTGSPATSQLITADRISNQEFFETYARPGRVGLIGGISLIDKAIRVAERHAHPQKQFGSWSHALIFGERRPDGHQWLIESDLSLHRRHIRLGVQENRAEKYHDEAMWPTVAVLDFGLDEAEVQAVLRESLELLANHTRYSIRELFGTLATIRKPAKRAAGNPLAQDECFYCSAFVRHVFHRAGIDLTPGVDPKNTSPEDIAHSLVPHTTYLLHRPQESSRLRRIGSKIGGKIRRTKQKVRAVRSRKRA